MATSMNDKKAGLNKAMAKAHNEGVPGFPAAAIKKIYVNAQVHGDNIATAKKALDDAGFKLCKLAQTNREKNSNMHPDAWVAGWKASFKGLYPALHAAGVTWVERTERKDNDGNTIDPSYKLTSYGQNLSSDCQRVGRFNVDAKSEKGLVATRKATKAAAQAETKAAMSEVETELAELDAKLITGLNVLRDYARDAESPEVYERIMADLAAIVKREAEDNATMAALDAETTPDIDETDPEEIDEEIAELLQATG